MTTNSQIGSVRKSPGRVSGRNLLIMSLVSAAMYLLLSWLIFHFIRDAGLGTAFDHGFSVAGQLAAGVGTGIAGAAVIGFAMSRPPVSEVLHDFYIVEIVSKARFTAFDRIQLSLFAGAGEELLFRGAIQPLLGIWFTSVIFVGLHGYFKFRSPGHILFGALIFGLSVGLGYLYEYAGLIAAMSGHAVYDVIMLYMVRRRGENF